MTPGALRDGSPVDRRTGLTHREFVTQYLRPMKPVIVADAIEHWPATGRWTPAFFRERYGSRRVTVDEVDYALSDLLDLVEGSSAAKPAPYLRNLVIDRWAPDLMADIQPLPHHTQPNWLDSRFFPERPSLTSIELYIGGAGATFPTLHYDNLHTHAFLMQLYGSKEYVFYPPDQGPWLYPRQGIETNRSSVEDIEHPDLDRFPLFGRAVAARCVLRAGEMLFVPAGWWHTARILEPAITVSANTVNASNWKAFLGDYDVWASRHRPRKRTAVLSAYVRVFGFIGCLGSLRSLRASP
jgi:histone arginine demethylase JMJD6